MTTSILFALAFGTMPAAPPEWHQDYAQALKAAESANKPLAVFIGTGPEGYKTLINGGSFPPQAERTLGEKYTCLYIDAAQPAGRSTADSFRANGPMIVLSDKTRGYQAVRQYGPVQGNQLVQLLDRYADYSMTTGDGVTRTSYYEPQGTAQTGGSGASASAPTCGPGGCNAGGCCGGGCGGGRRGRCR